MDSPRVRMPFQPCPPTSMAETKTKIKNGRTGQQQERHRSDLPTNWRRFRPLRSYFAPLSLKSRID